jgi:hypothetical protein
LIRSLANIVYIHAGPDRLKRTGLELIPSAACADDVDHRPFLNWLLGIAIALIFRTRKSDGFVDCSRQFIRGLFSGRTIAGVVIYTAATVDVTTDIVAVNFEVTAGLGAAEATSKISERGGFRKSKLTNPISSTRPFCYLLVNSGLQRSNHLFLSHSDFSVVIVKTVDQPQGKYCSAAFANAERGGWH